MQRRRKLPVGEIIIRVFASARSNVWSLIRLGLPVAVVGLLSTLYYEFYEPGKILFGDFSLKGFALMVLNTAAYAMAIIGIHQVFLLSPGVVANTSTVRWTHKEMKWFFWTVITLFLLFLVALVPGCVMVSIAKESPEESATMAEIGGWLFSLFLGYFMVRWSLIFPSVATDERLQGLSDAWDLSSGNVFGLFILVGVIPMLTSWAIGFLPSDKSLSLSIAVQVVGWVVATLEIGLLSHSYAFLRDNDENEVVYNSM